MFLNFLYTFCKTFCNNLELHKIVSKSYKSYSTIPTQKSIHARIFPLHINLKHFCLSCGIRVLNSMESARYCVFNSGIYPKT